MCFTNTSFFVIVLKLCFQLQGSKGRTVTVLYEGTAATSPPVSPQRSPCYFEDLTSDNAEVVRLQMRTHLEGKICSSSQTEKVVVLEDEMEVLELVSSVEKKKTTDGTTQTDHRRTKDTSTQTRSFPSPATSLDCAVQTDPADLSIITTKLDEIMQMLTAINSNSSLNVSDVMKWVNSNTSTPLPGMQTVTILPAEEVPVVMEVPTYEVQPTSPILHSEAVSRESEANSPPAKKLLFAEPPEAEIYMENATSGERIPFSEVSNRIGNRKTSETKERVLTLECRSTANTFEIKDRNDIVQGDFEFRVRRDILADLKDASCSDGNFLWLVARRIYSSEELIGRNFFGRKGRPPLSPRRRNCLKAAFLECCGSSYMDFTKAVNSVNNGIRSLRR